MGSCKSRPFSEGETEREFTSRQAPELTTPIFTYVGETK